MKDFARLAVGILLLGMAIYLSLNFEEAPTNTKLRDDASEGIEESTPDWQAQPSSANWLASTNNDDSFVRPQFDNPRNQLAARPLNPSRDPLNRFQQPPQISDRYHPSRPLMVTGQLQRESNLVPVQPKPAFTGTISLVRQIHTIREGDSLQSIAREYFGSSARYLDIYLLNKDVLSNPARLPAGVEIRIPGE